MGLRRYRELRSIPGVAPLMRVFISGPLLAAAIATTVSPEAAVLAGVAMQTGGALGLAATPVSRRSRPPERKPGATRAGALSIPGRRTLVVSLAGGLWYGARRWHAPAHVRFLVVSGVLVAGLAPLPLAGSMLAFAVLVVVVGVAAALACAPAAAALGLVVALAARRSLTT